MNDSLDRSISYLRLSVTDLCNLRCCYCMPKEGVNKRRHGEICSLEELRDMVVAAVSLGVKKIRITGGEPLVRRGIVELCGMIRLIQGVEELCLTTNAALLPRYATSLREAGVDRLNISLDSLKPERFHEITRLGTLADALLGIAAAEAAGFRNLKINCVLMGGVNEDEIADFVALTWEKPWEVRFIELMPMGVCADWEKSKFLPAKIVLERVPELRAAGEQGVAKLYQIPGAKGKIGLIEVLEQAFCQQCNRIRITADGKLKPCLHSGAELPLRGLEGEALRQAITEGIRTKPRQHELVREHVSRAKRDMNQIGG